MPVRPGTGAPARENAHTLVLGVGNLLLGDEGIGVHVVRRLQELPLPPGVEVLDGGTAGTELIRFCTGRKKIIIVDALLGDADPGSTVRCTPSDLHLASGPAASAHGENVSHLLRQLQTLSPAPDVLIFGVIPLSLAEPSTDLSPPVRDRLNDIVGAVLRELSLHGGGD